MRTRESLTLGAYIPNKRRNIAIMNKKLFIKTWGCQMNEYDSQKMAELLDATHGYTLAEEAEDADVILLNTCSIREKSAGEGIPSIRPLEEFKTTQTRSNNRCRRLCCLSRRCRN